MRPFIRSGTIGVLAVGGVVLLGPRVPLDTDQFPPVIPGEGVADLEAYLAAREAAVPDLVPGTGKTLLWADPDAPEPTPVSVVYLHGFSASRQEVAPLPQMVADSLGANLFLTRLTGHGRSPEAMAEGSVAAWVADAEEAMEVGTRVGDRVVLVGTSTGGTLALLIAADERWRDRIAALVLISPNLGPRDRASEVLLWPWGGLITRMVTGPERAFTPRNQEQARFWTERYPVEALLPMMGLVKLARDLDPEGIVVPILLAYSPRDRVIDVSRIEELYPRLGATRKRLLTVDGAETGDHHVLAGDILAPENTGPLTREILAFVER